MKNEDITQLKIELIDGNMATRYTTQDKELKVDNCVITEKGMESELPLIDFQLSDGKGNVYYTVLSGRIVNMISAVIKGVNLRNHGIEEP